MDVNTLALAAVMTLIGFDHVMMATPALLRRDGVFWAVVGLEGVGAGVVGAYGMPGLSAVPVAGWLVCALLAYHAVHNLVRRRAVLDRMDEEGA